MNFLKDVSSWNSTYKVREFNYDFSNLQKRINEQAQDAVAQVNIAVGQAKKNLDGSSKFTLPNFNVSDIEKTTKLIASRLENLSKTVESVIGQVQVVANTVNGTLSGLSQMNLGEDEYILELKSSVNKILKGLTNMGKVFIN